MGSSLAFLLFLCLSLNVHGSATVAASPADTSVVRETCKQTLHPELCVKLVSPAYTFDAKPDASELVAVVLGAARDRAANISAYLGDMFDDVANTQLQQCLNDCSESYMDAVAQMEDSMPAVQEKKFDDVGKFVGAAMGDAFTCRSSCGYAPLHDRHVLSKMNTEFHQMCGIIVSLMKLIPR